MLACPGHSSTRALLKLPFLFLLSSKNIGCDKSSASPNALLIIPPQRNRTSPLRPFCDKPRSPGAPVYFVFLVDPEPRGDRFEELSDYSTMEI